MTELPIPDEAWEAAESVAGRRPIVSTEILSIARPVLIAWLEAEAEACDTPWEQAAFLRSARKLEADRDA